MQFLNRFFVLIILIILLIVGGSFAYHNSHNVALNLWMFGDIEVPLWVLMFSFLFTGFLLALIISRVEVWRLTFARRKAEKAAKKLAKKSS